jgi:hypothetical protein
MLLNILLSLVAVVAVTETAAAVGLVDLLKGQI